jgi:hypothetical protein
MCSHKREEPPFRGLLFSKWLFLIQCTHRHYDWSQQQAAYSHAQLQLYFVLNVSKWSGGGSGISTESTGEKHGRLAVWRMSWKHASIYSPPSYIRHCWTVCELRWDGNDGHLSVSIPSIYSDIMGKWKDIMGGLPRYANLCKV